MMLNLLGAAAFLSSSPMVGDARGGWRGCVAAVREGLFFVPAARARAQFGLPEPFGRRRRCPALAGCLGRYAGVVLASAKLSIFWLSKHLELRQLRA